MQLHSNRNIQCSLNSVGVCIALQTRRKYTRSGVAFDPLGLRTLRRATKCLGPRNPGKGLQGPPSPGPQKVWKKFRKSPKSLEKSLENVRSGLFRDFFQTFLDFGVGGGLRDGPVSQHREFLRRKICGYWWNQ